LYLERRPEACANIGAANNDGPPPATTTWLIQYFVPSIVTLILSPDFTGSPDFSQFQADVFVSGIVTVVFCVVFSQVTT
jgi:hypothetical protein